MLNVVTPSSYLYGSNPKVMKILVIVIVNILKMCHLTTKPSF